MVIGMNAWEMGISRPALRHAITQNRNNSRRKEYRVMALSEARTSGLADESSPGPPRNAALGCRFRVGRDFDLKMVAMFRCG